MYCGTTGQTARVQGCRWGCPVKSIALLRNSQVNIAGVCREQGVYDAHWYKLSLQLIQTIVYDTHPAEKHTTTGWYCWWLWRFWVLTLGRRMKTAIRRSRISRRYIQREWSMPSGIFVYAWAHKHTHLGARRRGALARTCRAPIGSDQRMLCIEQKMLCIKDFVYESSFNHLLIHNIF